MLLTKSSLGVFPSDKPERSEEDDGKPRPNEYTSFLASVSLAILVITITSLNILLTNRLDALGRARGLGHIRSVPHWVPNYHLSDGSGATAEEQGHVPFYGPLRPLPAPTQCVRQYSVDRQVKLLDVRSVRRLDVHRYGACRSFE